MRLLSILKIQKKQLPHIFLSLVLAAGLFEPLLLPTPASAVAKGYFRLDRVKINTATGGSVCFNPNITETTNVAQMAITFPVSGTPGTADATHFGVNQTAANWTWDTTATNIPVGTTAFPGTATTSTVSNGIVTFIVTTGQTLTTGTTYCLHFTGTSTLTTPTAAANNLIGTIQLNNSGGTQLANELANYAASVISNDQITVTATVPASFTMSLSGNTAAIGTLTTSGAPTSATGITLTVSTNAANGWTAWVKNANANSTLTSATTSDTSISSGAFAAGAGNIHNLTGAAGYGLAVAAGSGSPTVATEYSTSSPSVGSLDSTQFEKIVSNTVPSNGNTATLTFSAEASATTKPASDYTDTVTITAAGQF